jgi:hypothetical protein
MRILRGPLEGIAAKDIEQLCADEASENTEIEFKCDLPCKNGKQADPWYTGKSFADYARNQITEEIVAGNRSLCKYVGWGGLRRH